MDYIYNLFLSALAIPASFIISFLPVNMGSAVPNAPALVDTYLAANIDSAATSMTLANGNTRAGTALIGYTCFTIDANSPTVEYVCGTASGTAITALSRGVDVLNPNTTSSALAFPHRRFASVQISDYPTLQILVRKMNGTDSLDTPLSYSNGTPSFITSSGQLVSKAYADNLVITGAAIASESVPGISILASQSQLALGTATSSNGTSTYSLIPQNRYFNSTSTATTTGVVTKSSGKISQGFLDLTEGYTFSGGVTSTATTSLSGQTILSTTTLSAVSANSFITTDANKNLVSTTTPNFFKFSVATASSSYTTSAVGEQATSSISVTTPSNGTKIIIEKFVNAGITTSGTSASSTLNVGGNIFSFPLGSGNGSLVQYPGFFHIELKNISGTTGTQIMSGYYGSKASATVFINPLYLNLTYPFTVTSTIGWNNNGSYSGVLSDFGFNVYSITE